ncbi:unnamed protein product [Calypogeia fissa]
MADPEESDYSGSGHSDEENSSSDEEEEQLHERPVKEPRKDAVYNTVGLHEKLEEMGWPEDVEWLHSLALTYPDGGTAVDVDDDLQREMSFYTQALEAAREAYQKFQALGIPFQRPTDYYAEMVKTDTHMLKIKDKLLQEKTNLEEMDERRKARESKKFAKEVQAEKLKERSKRKKEDIESVKKWRKVRQKSGFTEGGDDAPPIEFDTGKRGKQKGENKFSGGRGRDRDRQPSKNRQFRNEKYGNGGKSSTRNDADSSADDSTFRASFKGRGRGGSGRGRGGGGSFRGRFGGRGRGGQSSRGSSRGRGRGRG